MGFMFRQLWEALPSLLRIANLCVVVLSFYAVFRILKLVITGDTSTYEVKYRIIQAIVGILGKIIEDALLNISADESMLLIPVTAALRAFNVNLCMVHDAMSIILDLAVAVPFAILEVKAYKERKGL